MPFGKEENVAIDQKGKGRKYVRHEESHICFISRFLILIGKYSDF